MTHCYCTNSDMHFQARLSGRINFTQSDDFAVAFGVETLKVNVTNRPQDIFRPFEDQFMPLDFCSIPYVSVKKTYKPRTSLLEPCCSVQTPERQVQSTGNGRTAKMKKHLTIVIKLGTASILQSYSIIHYILILVQCRHILHSRRDNPRTATLHTFNDRRNCHWPPP